MSSVPADERPPSFIVRLTQNSVLEALDRSVGLTTISLDPTCKARTFGERQRLLERFMVDLTLAEDRSVASSIAAPLPLFASPALIDRACAVVRLGLGGSDVHCEELLEAVAARQLHKGVQSAMDQLMEVFSEQKPRGLLAEYRKSIALNYSMSYGDTSELIRSDDGPT